MLIGTLAIDRWAVTFDTVTGAWLGYGPPSPLLALSDVTVHPSTACVPTSYISMWHCNFTCALSRVKCRMKEDVYIR